ncbi:diaminopimelate epimerase [Solicola sp. PLA-1-18]|uniref:diaminopimelate epimerase n=1 Tax=Solicola sp. PLA-1-18 TaxID=3380532 RepID=UPI003B806C4D
MSTRAFAWLKGHGTQNDFVLLPDHDGSVHGDLDPGFVAALCHRRRGLGADGVLRVIRTEHVAPELAGDAEWFMDYRNADGSVSEMCGNGVRVFAKHLLDEGLVPAGEPVAVGTRDGVKTVTRDDDGAYFVDMGVPRLLGESKVTPAGRTFAATGVDMGNPHAVAFVDDLADAGPLTEEPGYDTSLYPDGVNIELVVRRGERHVAMRVHERGSGETLSCGTGACAVAVAAATADDAPRPATYRVDLPGGTLVITWREDGRLLMAGPAEIVAGGEMHWHGEESRA